MRRNTYNVCYKHADLGSDELGCSFATVEEAKQEIAAIRSGNSKYVAELAQAALWVIDHTGRIVWS